MLTYRLIITRSMLRSESQTLFVFGDNFLRYGLAGQAKEMRGEPNAVGIPTKKAPSMHSSAFFNNSEEEYRRWLNLSTLDRDRLWQYEGEIVWPKDGIGTGLAQLQERAPMIWKSLESFRLDLEKKHSGRKDSENTY